MLSTATPSEVYDLIDLLISFVGAGIWLFLVFWRH